MSFVAVAEEDDVAGALAALTGLIWLGRRHSDTLSVVMSPRAPGSAANPGCCGASHVRKG